MTADMRARRGPAIEVRPPMRRFARPASMVEVVVFLHTGGAGFVTGSAWTADRGRRGEHGR